jgi:hypothetical protein
MKINLKNLVEVISDKTNIKKSSIDFRPYFFVNESIDADGKSTQQIKDLFVKTYKSGCMFKGLHVEVYADNYKIFEFVAKNIDPSTNNIIDLMQVGVAKSCWAVGKNGYHPYLYINSICSGKSKDDYKKFLTLAEIDTNFVMVECTPKSIAQNHHFTDEHKDFLEKPQLKVLDRNFFRNIEEDSYSPN